MKHWKKTRLPLAGLTLLAVLPPAVSAQEMPHQQSAFYIGGGVGYSRVGSEDFPTNDEDFNDNRVSWKALAGFRFNPILSLEGQYIDFGKAEGSLAEVKAHGWTAGLVADLPLPYLQPYAKAGALFWNADFDSSVGVGGFHRSEDGTSFTWGGGVRFNLAQNLDLRVEYERFTFEDTHVDNASAALQFSFY